MTSHSLAIVFTAILLSCNSPQPPVTQSEPCPESPSGQALLDKWKASPNGMKEYVMAFLKRGPNRDQDSTTAAQLQKAHMDNINRMAEEGKLLIAGPFMDDGDIRGIYVFDVRTIEEAVALTNTDPAIQAGRLVMELHPWYGPGALMEINDLYERSTVKEE